MEDNTPTKGPTDSSQISPEDAKTASMQAMDNEFEIEVAGHNQIVGKWAVEAERAKYAGTEHSDQLSLGGTYAPPGIDKELKNRPVFYPGGKQGETMIFYPYESDTVHVIGIDADPSTYAHEFRHRAFSQTNRGFWGGEAEEEKFNRILGGAYASNDAEWTKAIRLWRHNIKTETGEVLSLGEAERELVKTLQEKEDDIIQMEKDYLEKVGKPFAVPTVNGWFGPKEQGLKAARKGNFPLPWKRFLPAYEARQAASKKTDDKVSE